MAKPGDLFADDRAHRSTHEGEVHDPEIHRQRVDHTTAGEKRVVVPGVRDRLAEPARVVGKPEWVDRPHVDLDFLYGVVVENDVAVLVSPDAAVIVAVRAHVEVPRELFTDVRVPAGLAFLPDVGGNLETLAARLTGLLLFAEPGGHGRNVDCPGWIGNGKWKWGPGVVPIPILIPMR